MNPLSIAIVTKNRPQSLQICLSKLLPQCQRLHIPIKVIENLPVPVARNKALKWCPTNYLGFIDDDCLVNSQYCIIATKTITNHPKTAFIVGKSLLGNPRSPIAAAQYIYQRYWFHQKLQGKNATGWNLDTKNCILNVNIIKKTNTHFDTSFSIDGYDSSDTDFGFQLEKLGFHGYYEPKLTLHHQETTRLISMLKKAYNKGRLACFLYDKWKLEKELVDLNNLNLFYRLKQIRRLPKECKQYRTTPPIFVLIKLYQETYFQGFIKELKHQQFS